VTTMDRARRLLLAAGLLVAVGVTARTAWADEISCKAGISCYGASGLDELRGTKKKDNLCGEAGNDTLLGRGANDFLAGDAPIDTGADGNDRLYGGPGADTFNGGGSVTCSSR
jgi:Ca2+-binding RTX toxin-like protein